MIFKKTVITILILVSANTIAGSKILKAKSGVCATSDHFNQLVSAQLDNDENAVNYLLNSGYCGVTSKDLQMSVLYEKSGEMKIRVYFGNDQTAIFYTYIENKK